MNLESLIPELTFKAVRSSGAGGQHVNKVASKVELHFDILNSKILTDDQKDVLLQSLKTRLTTANILILQCDESRSQHKNKQLVIQRFIKIIDDGLIIPKERIPTKIPKQVIKQRLDEKKRQSVKKESRKKPDLE